MDRSLELLRRFAIAMPLVRAQSGRLASYWRLQSCDRDDLEQEFWLDLLTLWNDRGDACERLPRFVLFRHVQRQVAEVTASLVRSSWFWHHLRSTCQSADGFVLECATDAGLRHEPLRLHDLRSDLATVVSKLPDQLRETCHRLMSAAPRDELRTDANGWLTDAQAVALRDVFKSRDLHEYL